MRPFAADSTVVGKTLPVNGSERVIVGVMPPEFAFPERRTDLWMPLPRSIIDTPGDWSNYYLFMVGRIADGATLDRARQLSRRSHSAYAAVKLEARAETLERFKRLCQDDPFLDFWFSEEAQRRIGALVERLTKKS